jgi:mono/diheme cytochrome c family protein
MKIRKLLVIVASVLALVCTALAGFVGYASYQATRTWDIPYPAVTADRTEAGVARGAVLFHASCEVCHRPAFGTRASGALMAEVPEWLGSFYAPNLTSHSTAGIGALSDGAIARMIRFGVNREGRFGPMPNYGMSDADLAAVIGFLRSDDPLFAPDPQSTPRSRLSLAGKAALAAAGMFSPPERPVSGIIAPPPAPSVAYGRYLADSVYQCGDCHTAGMDPDKTQGPDAYAGGAEMTNATGQTIYSPNLTKDDKTGIGLWTRDAFARAIRDGIRPDGSALGYPMPHFRGARELEVDALYAYLRSLPARSNSVPGQTRNEVHAPKPTESAPEQLFVQLGCAGCHGPGARYQDKLAHASRKPLSDVARWIRNPEAFLPGTSMPTFAAVLDEASALKLASWIVEGGPQGLGGGADRPRGRRTQLTLRDAPK